MQKTENKPTVSVIIPAYNRAPLISGAIQSVLGQTYDDLEIIVVNDGSTDNTEEVVKGLQTKDGRIRYIRHDRNKGAAAARNTGIRAANTKYIAFQDSDDEWLPRKLEKQMAVFAAAPEKVGVVYTGFWRTNNGKTDYVPSFRITKKSGNVHKALLKENFVTTQSIVTRKDCLERAGMFDESLPRLQDWELVLRLSLYYEFICIDEPLLTSFYTSDSISANNEALVKALKLILLKHFGDFAEDNKLLSTLYFQIGNGLMLNGDFIKGRYYFRKAAKINPLNVKIVIFTFLSFLGRGVFYKLVENYRKMKDIVGHLRSGHHS